MAKNSALPSLYSPDPEDQELISEIKGQYSELSEALKARRLPFDPKWMALAQGFLAPTQTGSFGESLGYAAKGYSEAAQAEEKTAQERAALRLQLAQGELAQRQSTRGAQKMRQLFSGGETIEVGGQKFPNAFQTMTPAKAVAIGLENKELGELAFKFLEARQKEMNYQASGYYDNSSGKPVWVPAPGEAVVSRNIIWPDGKKAGSVDFTKTEASELDQAKKDKNWTRYWEIVDAATKPLPTGKEPVTKVDETPLKPLPSVDVSKVNPPSEISPPAVASSPITKGDIEVESARKKTIVEKTAAANVDATTTYKKLGNAALGMLPLFDRAENILKGNPKLRNSLGVLEKPDLLSAIGTVVDEGIRAGSFTINIPSFRKVVTQFESDPDTINDLMQLAQVEAMWQFQQRSGLGSGTSVSNFEQMMVNQMGPNVKDSYDAYLKKLAFMKEKANFDRAVGNKLKGTTQFEDFEGTKEFEDMFANYRKKISSIVYPDSKPAKSSGSKTEKTELQKVREALANKNKAGN
jgi:hypothetical protein